MALKRNFEELLSIFESIKHEIHALKSLDDGTLLVLKSLFVKKIHHLIVFEKLLQLGEIDFAKKLLLDYYLGEAINITKNTKDHGSDLEIYFSDILDVFSEDVLKSLFIENFIPLKNLESSWVQEAIKGALDSDTLPNWLNLEREKIYLNDDIIPWLKNELVKNGRENIRNWAIKVYRAKQDGLLETPKSINQDYLNRILTIFSHVDILHNGDFLYSIDFLQNLLDELNKPPD